MTEALETYLSLRAAVPQEAVRLPDGGVWADEVPGEVARVLGDLVQRLASHSELLEQLVEAGVQTSQAVVYMAEVSHECARYGSKDQVRGYFLLAGCYNSCEI